MSDEAGASTGLVISLDGTGEFQEVLEVRAENLECAGGGELGPRRRGIFESHLRSDMEIR